MKGARMHGRGVKLKVEGGGGGGGISIELLSAGHERKKGSHTARLVFTQRYFSYRFP